MLLARDSLRAQLDTPEALRELEQRAGVYSLEQLYEERDRLSERYNKLAAKYGSNGTAKELRENYFAVLATEHRDRLQMKGKPTEAMIDQAVRVDPRWGEYVDRETIERAAYLQLDDQMDKIKTAIMWGLALAKYASSEAYLQPRVRP